jgi:hypothetical protein
MEVEGHDRLLLRGAGVPGGELNARFNWVASPATTQAEFFKGVSLGESQAAMHHHTYWGGEISHWRNILTAYLLVAT